MGAPIQNVVAGYLEGEKASVDLVNDWIIGAARPYFRRLGPEWEDTLQEIRLEIFELLDTGKFRGDSSLKTYLWRVVAHSCLDRIRGVHRWQWTELEGDEELAPVGSRTRTKAETYATTDLLLRVLARASEECRRMWQLIIEGHSYREMSQSLGISEGALRVRTLRCRQRAVAIRAELTRKKV